MDGSRVVSELAGLSILSLASQYNRLLRLDFPRGDAPANAVLLVNGLEATEQLSRDFEFQVELISDNAHIDPATLIAKMATVSMVRSDGSLRYFNGYITEFQLVSADGGLAFYSMLLKPWLAFARLRMDCYSFHNRSAIELTEDTFADYDECDWKTRLIGELPRLTCANQYNETDHNHLHRRWEVAGLYYWYEHRSDGHTLWLSDHSGTAEEIDSVGDQPGEIRFHAESGSGEDDSIREWAAIRQIKPGLSSLVSYDYKNPSSRVVVRKSANRQGDVAAREIYQDVGFGYATSSDGDAIADRRMQAIDSDALYYSAKGNSRCVLPGRSFKLADHYQNPGASSKYLIVKVVHSASNNFENGSPSHYDNILTCVGSTTLWRPGVGHCSAPPPNPGVLTATVVGPKGEEIYTDELGRAKVQFHWDRVGKFDDFSSAWIRVMTGWAGSNFGQISLPRIGQEVVLQFLDGNIDHPIIIGSVYNRDNMPPWELPANKTQSGIQTRSTKDGRSANANSLRFEDLKGKEQLWLHAEKDQLTEVENNEVKWVGNDRQKTVDHNETTEVKNDRTETVGNNESINIKNDRNEHVTHNESINIGGNRSERVAGNELVSVGGTSTELVKLAKSETIGLAKALTIGGAYGVTVGAVMNTLVTLSQYSEVMVNKVLKVGKKFHASAGDEYEMVVGKATLKMEKDGSITLTGTKIVIGASGPVQINGKDVDVN
jgi:type VI secretion system secreted protein VgrG